jgi:hypothetical protein
MSVALAKAAMVAVHRRLDDAHRITRRPVNLILREAE